MRLQIRSQHFKLGDEARGFIERRLQFSLARFGPRLSVVRVHLSERLGPQGRLDYCCRIVGRLLPAGEVVAEEFHENVDGAVDRAAGWIERAIRREMDRRQDRKFPGENGIEAAQANSPRRKSHARPEPQGR